MKLFGGSCSSSFQLQIILVVAVVCLIVYILYVTKDLVAIEKQVHLQQQQLDQQAAHIGALIKSSHAANAAAAIEVAAAKKAAAAAAAAPGGAAPAPVPAPVPAPLSSTTGTREQDDDAVSILGGAVPDVTPAPAPEPEPVDDDADKENKTAVDADEEIAQIEDVIAATERGEAEVEEATTEDDAAKAGDDDDVDDDDDDPTLEMELQRIKSLSWAELKLLAKERGISSRNMNKDQLIQKMMEQQMS